MKRISLFAIDFFLRLDERDLSVQLGLYDAYLETESYQKLDALVQKFADTPICATTTNHNLPDSYVVVYIWDPKNEWDSTTRRHRNIHFGHASMKVVHNDHVFHFSWFPDTTGKSNRSTPSSYGPRNVLTTSGSAKTKIQELYQHSEPNNLQEQILDLI
jgi:hypothetical protein